VQRKEIVRVIYIKCTRVGVKGHPLKAPMTLYANVHEDSEVWFDDFSFIEGVK
jgi:hypothetical protein